MMGFRWGGKYTFREFYFKFKKKYYIIKQMEHYDCGIESQYIIPQNYAAVA